MASGALKELLKLHPKFLVANPKFNSVFLHRNLNQNQNLDCATALPLRRYLSDRCHCEDEKKMIDNIKKECPNATCGKKKKRGLFSLFFGDKEPKKKYPPEMCRMKYAKDCEADPDLTVFGGKAYKTCGKRTYVIQKDKLPVEEDESSKEDLILRKIEAPMGVKYEIEDPMPSFRSAEQRLLDLQDRKLHPAYKRFQGLRKKPPTKEEKEIYERYTNINFSKLEAAEIPKRIRFNKNLLESKNLFAEFKRVEPPKQLLGKMLEIKKNEKPTLERKRDQQQICRDDESDEGSVSSSSSSPPSKVFDTLNQK